MSITQADSKSSLPNLSRPILRAVSQRRRPADDASSGATTIDKAAFLHKFTESALQQVKEGNHEKYSELVKVFLYSQCDAEQSPEQYVSSVTQWISAVSANVSALDVSYRELLNAILYSDWITAPDDQFVHRYSTLVLQIVSAHPAWVSQTMTALVRWFAYGVKPADVAMARAVHNRLHSLLEQVYRAIPTCGASLVAAIADAHPFRDAKTNVQVLFLQNALRTLDYAVVLRRDVLYTVLNRIIQVDVEVQIEVEDLRPDNEEASSINGYALEEGIFEFEKDDESDEDEDEEDDSDSDSGSDSSGFSPSSNLGEITFNAEQVVAKLDAIMSTLFGWLEKQTEPNTASSEVSEATSQLFLLFLDIFNSLVLPTFKSRYTQFFVFYLCSKDSGFADYFLGTMVGTIGDPSHSTSSGQVPIVARVAAASYLSSFVARARYLKGEGVRKVMGGLVQWAGSYIEWQEKLQRDAEEELKRRQPHPWARTYAQAATSSLNPAGGPRSNSSPTLAADFERHAAFYAVTQAIIYMFCFRWRDMAEAPGGGPVIESELENLQWCAEVEGIQRIVFSKLNPLRGCSSQIANEFARVASQTSFMFCHTVLQQNRRTSNESKEQSDSEVPSIGNQIRTELETFFPFDPMLLPISRQYIDGIYLRWQEVGEELSSSSEEDEDYDNDEDNANIAHQMVAMSISPARPLSVLHSHVLKSS
ncbi:DNA independent RNA polymerase I transcription factor [Coemansia aciculifera]|uniref:DNA independent RNA polymerase I transcription factor n=1 Tax=Coemansia aciculifera TaxID=417176 RepID=A0ACC1M9N8_9FUNG|nr:DNA independent RNA polymerase I transcription factor [Coemansia aciculifera]